MDYRLKPMNQTCAGTQQPLQPGTVCYSALVETAAGVERLDFSEAGWSGLPENGIGYWKCFVPIPEEKQAATVDVELLMGYFESIMEEPNPAQEKMAYVLALYLLQRRRLKLEGSSQRDAVEFLDLHGSRGEGPFQVKDQQLPQDEIEQLQRQLNQQLTTGWNAA